MCREAISARIDGEDPGIPKEAIEAHLAGCQACRDWSIAVVRLTRRARLAPADPVPELTDSVLRAVGPFGHQRRPRRAVLLRLALALIAAVQIGVGMLFALPGAVADRPQHVVYEAGAWNVALGVGLLAVAVHTRRAAGMLPLLGTLVAAVAVVETLGFLHGHLRLVTFLPHLLLVAGFVLVALLAREGGLPGGNGSEDALPPAGARFDGERTDPQRPAPGIGGEPAATHRSAA